jgi:hypothetical protein
MSQMRAIGLSVTSFWFGRADDGTWNAGILQTRSADIVLPALTSRIALQTTSFS